MEHVNTLHCARPRQEPRRGVHMDPLGNEGLMRRGRDYHSSQLHPTTVKMNTCSHQNRITALAQEAVDVKQYFRFWTCDTALTLDTIRTLQHLSLLSRTSPKCHCGADKQLYQTQNCPDGWECRCSRHAGETRESIRHNSWFYRKRHPIAHYIVMVRLLDSKTCFQQVMDEVGVTVSVFVSIDSTCAHRCNATWTLSCMTLCRCLTAMR